MNLLLDVILPKLKLIFPEPTYEGLSKKKPQLLSGEWSLCAHKKGFWNGKSSEVSDKTGRYNRLTGDCKTCSEEVVLYRALK